MQVNAAVYCRISRDRVGAGLGVERQRQDCEELARKLGWSIVVAHTDNDLSAYSGKPRPGYSALLEDVRSSKVTGILAWHSDRLHRSPTELEEFIGLCENHGVTVQTVRAGEVDLSTPSGRAVARTLGAWARHEVEHMIARQKRAKLQAAQDGKFRGGRRAFGYEADGMTINEAEAEVVREMAARLLAGESLRSLAADLNGRGLTGTFGGSWTGVAVREVLIKARTGGRIEHNGEILGQAQWPAVLPEATWRAVRGLLTAPGRVRPKQGARRWLMSGLAVCGLADCGLPVRISSTRNPGSGPARFAYRCSGERVHVSRAADHVDQLITDAVLERLSRKDAVKLLRPRSKLVDVTALHNEANALRAQLDELAVLWARKVMSASQFAAASAELNATLEDVEKRITAATLPSPLDGLIGVEDIGAVWEDLSLDRQRAVVATLVDVTILPGKRGRKAGGIYFDPESVTIEFLEFDD